MDEFEKTEQFHFKSPAFINLSGSTYSGKTEFMAKLIENHEQLIRPNVERIVFVYAEYQPELFERLKKAYPNIEMVAGLSKLESNIEFSPEKPSLLVLDDVAYESGISEYVNQLATRHSHHANITVLYVTHNMFEQRKNNRTISLQTKYIVLFRSLRDIGSYKRLGTQLFGPESARTFSEIIKDNSRGVEYPHLVIDIYKQADPKIHMVGNLFGTDKIDFPAIFNFLE
jgi:hypothetical protein